MLIVLRHLILVPRYNMIFTLLYKLVLVHDFAGCKRRDYPACTCQFEPESFNDSFHKLRKIIPHLPRFTENNPECTVFNADVILSDHRNHPVMYSHGISETIFENCSYLFKFVTY